MHLTLGILRTSQAVFYAVAFFWLDGFAVPALAQVTQTVGRLTSKSARQTFNNQLDKVFNKENMDNNIREILGITADIMAILGISGLFSWGVFRKGKDPFSETAYTIFTYSWKTAIVLLLFLFLVAIGGAVASLLGFLASLPYTMLVGGSYQIGSSPIPDIIGWVISGLLFIPLFIVLANSIYQSSMAPLEKAIKGFSRKKEDDEQNV
jgi:hypothetical protein